MKPEKTPMRTSFALLKYVARALGNALGGVAGDLVVEVLPEVVQDVWAWWSRERSAEQRLGEVEGLAQESLQAVRQEAAEVVREELAGQPAEVQQAVEVYLTQVPAAIRRSLRRPADPTGTTVP